jgi:undecaprenyl-diphosphatase
VKPVWFFAAAALVVFLLRKRKHLEPTLLVGGALVAIGCVVYGTGVVHLPKIDKVLEDLGQALGQWTYLLVAVMAFLETGAFVGLLAPGETVILVGGVVAGQGEIDIVALIAVIWVCAVAGDLTSFFIGRRMGREFLVEHGRRVQITEARVQQVEGFFDRHGGKAIFLGRFVGLIRAIAPFLAGSSGMPLRRFAPYDIVGAGLWGTTFALLGYFFWNSLDQVLAVAKKGSLALAGVIVLGVALVSAVRWIREEENKLLISEWVQARSAPVRFTFNRLTPGNLGLELTTLLAVGSVGSFVCFGYAISLSGRELTPGDQRGLRWADDLRTGWLDDAARAITHLGTLPVAGGALAVVALALLVRRDTLEGVALLSGMALASAGVHVVKSLEGRPRPSGSLVETGGSSYPSGHAVYAMAWIAIAVALRRALPTLGTKAATLLGAIVLAVLIGLTRIELRAHWFSDVAGGWGLGALAFSLTGAAALIVGHMRQTSAVNDEQ